MRKLQRVLAEKRGSSELVGMVVVFLVMIALVVVFITGMKLVNEYTTLNEFADQMIVTVSDEGRCAGTAVDSRYAQLSHSTGLSPAIQYSASFTSAAKKTVQYGELIEITVSHTAHFTAIGIDIPVPLSVTKSAMSKQYWK